VPRAPEGQPGHPLYVPRPQGQGRVDNPEHYLVLYLSDSAAGAVGEAFGNFAIWTDELFKGPPVLPKSQRVLAIYDMESDLSILDLDDAAVLLRLGLRPSEVVSRDRQSTQAWALRIHQEGSWVGVKWWSRWEPTWATYALWDPTPLRVLDVMGLSRSHLAVEQASKILNRVWAG
jgi:hypothetical protein